jgi:hypothetical protein
MEEPQLMCPICNEIWRSFPWRVNSVLLSERAVTPSFPNYEDMGLFECGCWIANSSSKGSST